MNAQIGQLLDLLPARGPTAFDNFCEALLESDHSHVAEYLKSLEGKSQLLKNTPETMRGTGNIPKHASQSEHRPLKKT